MKRAGFIFCVLFILVLSRIGGHRLFGEAQMVLEITLIFVVGIAVFWWAISNERADDKDKKRTTEVTRDFMADLVAKSRKRSLGALIRRFLRRR